MRVNRGDMIATSFPGFADVMRELGARIEAAAASLEGIAPLFEREYHQLHG